MNAEFIIKKDLGVVMIGGVEYNSVDKYHFYSPLECEKKFKSLNDNSYVIMMKRSSEWFAISIEYLMQLTENIKKRLAHKLRKPKVKKPKTDSRRTKIEKYTTKATTRSNFIQYCERNGLDVNDFEQVVSHKDDKLIKYFYIPKQKRG